MCDFTEREDSSQAPCEFPVLPYTAQVVVDDSWVLVMF